MNFQLRERQEEGFSVVAVLGDLDVLSAPRLQERLGDLIAGGRRDIRVDMSDTEFVDSSGLSALVTAAKSLRAGGGDLKLVCPPGHVRRLIEIAALDQVFELLDFPEQLSGPRRRRGSP